MRSPRFPVRVKNDSGEEVPAYAVLVVTGSERMANNHVALKVEQVAIPPTAAGRQIILVNGPTPIGTSGADRYGWARYANHEVEWVAYDSADGTPAMGEMWGIEDAQWVLKKDAAGFLIVGEVDTDNERVQAMFLSDIELDVKLTEALTGATDYETGASEADATIMVMNSVGNLVSGDQTITITNRLAELELDSGAHMTVRWHWWYLEWRPIVGECA